MASAASKTQLAFQQHVKSAYLCHDDLSLDDELWLVAVPSTVNVADLSGQEVDLTGTKSQLKVGKEWYDATASTNTSDVSSQFGGVFPLLPSKEREKLKLSLGFKGQVTLSRHVKVPAVKTPTFVAGPITQPRISTPTAVPFGLGEAPSRAPAAPAGAKATPKKKVKAAKRTAEAATTPSKPAQATTASASTTPTHTPKKKHKHAEEKKSAKKKSKKPKSPKA
eukprot:m.15347 g.15347  ORF g.15347 m.15347 type:complete len:223 (-) comp6575_c0_seq1:525-1193(-)